MVVLVDVVGRSYLVHGPHNSLDTRSTKQSASLPMLSTTGDLSFLPGGK